MKTVFVYNPKSGSALPMSELKKLMKKYQIVIDEWLPLNEHFIARFTKAIKTQSTVFAYGGDGTIRAAAALLVGTKSVLIPLPGGTLNHFTKDIGIPQDLETALGGVDRWHKRQIDTASVNGEFFINNSSIGVYARSLETRDRVSSKLVKWPVAAWATIREIVKLRVYTVRIDDVTLKTPLIFVGNNQYSLQPGTLGTRTHITKGMVSLYTVNSDKRSAIFRIIIGIIINRRQSVIEQQKASFTIQLTQPNVMVAVDGEMQRMTPPLEYKSHPASLHIRAPQQ